MARDLAHQGEARPDTAGRFAGAGNPVARFEDALALGLRNPRPAVAHFELQRTVPGARKPRHNR